MKFVHLCFSPFIQILGVKSLILHVMAPSRSCCCSCSGKSDPDLAPEWTEAVSEVTCECLGPKNNLVVKIWSLPKTGTQIIQQLQLKHPFFPFSGLISRKDWTRSVSHLVNKVADVFPQVWWKKCSSTCWGRFWAQQTGTFRASTSDNATLQCFNIWSKTLGIIGFTRELDGILFCLLGRQYLQQRFIQHETCWKIFSATF